MMMMVVCLGRWEAEGDKCMILIAFLLLVQTGARMLHRRSLKVKIIGLHSKGMRTDTRYVSANGVVPTPCNQDTKTVHCLLALHWTSEAWGELNALVKGVGVGVGV